MRVSQQLPFTITLCLPYYVSRFGATSLYFWFSSRLPFHCEKTTASMKTGNLQTFSPVSLLPWILFWKIIFQSISLGNSLGLNLQDMKNILNKVSLMVKHN